jgi:hypothetical protein
MEIYLEELDLAIPTDCDHLKRRQHPRRRNISTNILDLDQAMLDIPRSQGARSILLQHQVQAPHLCL